MSDIIVKDLTFKKSSKGGGYHIYEENGMIVYVNKKDMPSPIQKIRVTVEPA